MAIEQIVDGSSFISPLIMPLTTVLITLVSIHFWQITRRERKMGNQMPGPAALPIIGNAHTFLQLKNDGN